MFFSTSLTLLAIVCSAFSTPTVQKRATCTPTSAGNAGVDDVPAIQSAIKSCGNGGIIVIPAGHTYAIRSPLSFAGCVNCEFQVEGILKLSDDTTFWNGQEAVILLDGITGAKVHSVTGTGLVDGNGVPHWIKFAEDSSYQRPTLMYITGSKSITVFNLAFRNAPNVFHSATGGSSNIVYTGLTLTATAEDGATPKNTDGFDVGSSTGVTISNTKVTNQDDCVAFKAGATFTTVTQITCTGSHGLSVGSLGSGAGSTDMVTNILVDGATMINSSKAVGIKLWEGGSAHGTATVRNVTFSNVIVQNSDYAAQIQSCYEAANPDSCIPSNHVVTDVFFNNFSGPT
ncbi:hypothetical protein V5O48_002115 [Marasmius crinis-equi]|uniref:Uncharacterized protein n=1 Tax=Marasmius crinis-equi TaxID=585013 RepID=A0ABR3FWH1_9AGAR